MKRTLATGAAATAMLALLAATPADAQQSRKLGSAYLNNPGSFTAATGGGNTQNAAQGAKQLRGKQGNAAIPGTLQGAYAYQLWLKKRDALLPMD